jgi:hypothetical protein
VASSRECSADVDIQSNSSSFANLFDPAKRFIGVRARPALLPFQADDASSILVGRSLETFRPRQLCGDGSFDLPSSSCGSSDGVEAPPR